MPIALESPRRGSLTHDVDFPAPVDNQAPNNGNEMMGDSFLMDDSNPLNSLNRLERQQDDGRLHSHEVLAASLYVPYDSGEENSERTMVTSLEPRVACDLKSAEEGIDKDLDSKVGQSSISGYDKGFLCPHPNVKSSCFVGCSPGKKVDTLPLHATLIPSTTHVATTTEQANFCFVGPSKTVLVVHTRDPLNFSN